MRILLVNAKPALADALAADSDVSVELLWPRRHHFAGMEPPLRVPLRFYGGGTKLNLHAAWQLRRIIDAYQPDVVHAFYGRALAHAVLAVSTLRRRPLIVSFRGVTSLLSRWDAGDWLSYRHPLVGAHACESEAVRQALIHSGIDADRCFVTFNSMYTIPHRRHDRAALAQFGISEQAFVVGTVASMRRVKGIDILLRAAIQCNDLPDVYWLLFGRVMDPEISRLAEDPRIRDRVRLAGHRPDASELISAADLFVMPSRAEALCQALLEAMHQGVCPVVSDAGGMKEVVRHGQDGLVVPAENATALAVAIRTLHGDRALVTRYAAAARERVATSFTPERMAAKCLAAYRQLLAQLRRCRAA